MKREKKVLIGIVAISILIFSVISVSADFKDWFKFGTEKEGLEGELPASYEAKVQLANAAPVVVAFRPTDDILTSGADGPGSSTGDVGAIGNSEIWARIVFIVEDANFDYTSNDEELPGIDAVTNPINVGPLAGAGDILVEILSPSDMVNSVACQLGYCRTRTTSSGAVAGTDFPNGDPSGNPVGNPTASCEAVSCDTGTNPNCPCTGNPGNPCGAASPNAVGSDNRLQVQYNCYIKMNYWDEPTAEVAPAANDFWRISVQIEDRAGGTDTVASGDLDNGGVASYDFDQFACTAIGDCDYIDHLSTRLIATTGLVSWTGVVLTAGNDPADGPTDLELNNRANDDIPTVTIDGDDLWGVGVGGGADSTSRLRIGAFSADENSEERSGVTQCNDGVDNVDAEDTLIDLADPGCVSSYDDDEVNTGPIEECATATSNILDDTVTPVTIGGVAVPFTAGGAGDVGTVDNDNMYFCIRNVLSGSTCTVGGVVNQLCKTGADKASYRAASDATVTPPFTNPWIMTEV